MTNRHYIAPDPFDPENLIEVGRAVWERAKKLGERDPFGSNLPKPSKDDVILEIEIVEDTTKRRTSAIVFPFKARGPK